MKKRLALAALCAVFLAPSPPVTAAPQPAVTRATPLRAVTLKRPPGPGRLFPPGAETAKVYFMDERAEPVLSLGFDGVEETAAGFYGIWTRVPNGVADLFEAASRDAVEALGMRWGTEGMVVSVLVKELRIQHFNRQGGPAHFVAYGRFQAMLKSGDGQDLREEDVRFAGAATAASPDEALGSLYARMAWECTLRALLAYFPRNAEPAAVDRLITALDSRDAAARARAAWWLGATGGKNAAEKMLAALPREEDLGVFAAEAESLARIRAPQGREEIAGILSGATKAKGRDPARMEDAWVLLRALALYGDRDLSPKVPAVRDMRGRLTDLARFEQSGNPPRMTPVETDGRKRSMEWVTGAK